MDRPASDVSIIMLAVEVRVLRDLREWEVVGSRLEAITGALSDTDSITDRDAKRLQVWAKRWRHVHPEVRSFYRTLVENLDDYGSSAAVSALWTILEGRGPLSMTTNAHGLLYGLWEDRNGRKCPFLLVPDTSRIR